MFSWLFLSSLVACILFYWLGYKSGRNCGYVSGYFDGINILIERENETSEQPEIDATETDQSGSVDQNSGVGEG
jgi:hypothetical protein